MPSRLKRYQSEGHDHFITFSCYRRQPFLTNDHARTVFLHTLEQLRQRHHFEVHGYVLMPEHVHLLLGEPEQETLATTLSVLKGQTSKLLKGDHKQFWQTRYYDFNVLTHPKWLEKLRYTHHNPVKRGLALNAEDYRWSSARHWLTGERGIVQVTTRWPWTPQLSAAEKRSGAPAPDRIPSSKREPSPAPPPSSAGAP